MDSPAEVLEEAAVDRGKELVNFLLNCTEKTDMIISV